MFYGRFGPGKFPECRGRLEDRRGEAGTGFARSVRAARA